jgi:hypothetical protein
LDGVERGFKNEKEKEIVTECRMVDWAQITIYLGHNY